MVKQYILNHINIYIYYVILYNKKITFLIKEIYMETKENNLSVTSSERILYIIEEAENELFKIKPEIDYLEGCQKKLLELKEQQFKLNSLILSLKSINKISSVDKININVSGVKIENLENIKSSIDATKQANININMREIFLPDQAFSQVKNYLRTKNNLNYEIFKAVVFNSGLATTEQIKTYLVENNIKQPKTGKLFNDIELKEISSRTNYLVRKQILISVEPGVFKSVFGWNLM